MLYKSRDLQYYFRMNIISICIHKTIQKLVGKMKKANLRASLKEGAIANASRDLKIASE